VSIFVRSGKGFARAWREKHGGQNATRESGGDNGETSASIHWICKNATVKNITATACMAVLVEDDVWDLVCRRNMQSHSSCRKKIIAANESADFLMLFVVAIPIFGIFVTHTLCDVSRAGLSLAGLVGSSARPRSRVGTHG
jgi:hypothetical protein